jgi:hypothetical protein
MSSDQPTPGGWTASPVAIGLTRGAETLLYVVNLEADYPIHAALTAVAPLTNSQIMIRDQPPGRDRALWHSPATGSGLDQTVGLSDGHTLPLPLPASTEAAAAKLVLDFVLQLSPHGPGIRPLLRLEGDPNGIFDLEWSASFAHGNPLLHITNSSAATTFPDPTAGFGPTRFYRAWQTGPWRAGLIAMPEAPGCAGCPPLPRPAFESPGVGRSPPQRAALDVAASLARIPCNCAADPGVVPGGRS